MGILGFTSSRWLDMSSGFTPKQELDKAHFAKMMEILKRKKKNSTSVSKLLRFYHVPYLNLLLQTIHAS